MKKNKRIDPLASMMQLESDTRNWWHRLLLAIRKPGPLISDKTAHETPHRPEHFRKKPPFPP